MTSWHWTAADLGTILEELFYLTLEPCFLFTISFQWIHCFLSELSPQRFRHQFTRINHTLHIQTHSWLIIPHLWRLALMWYTPSFDNNNNNTRTIFILLSSWPQVIATVHWVHLMSCRTAHKRPSTLRPKRKKVKEVDLYSAFIEVPYTQGT